MFHYSLGNCSIYSSKLSQNIINPVLELFCYAVKLLHVVQFVAFSGNWRSERTCNGNDTCQETLLASSVHRAASIREPHRNHPVKADSVEVENVVVNVVGAQYETQGETVRLRLIAEESTVIASGSEVPQQDHGF